MQKRRQQRARRGLEMAERATSDRNVASKRAALAAAAGLTIAAALAPAAARGDVVWGNFETGTAPGFGALTNAGVQPWADPVAGNSITAPAGSGRS